MKLNAKFLAILVFVLMFGGIAFSAAINKWNTMNNKVPLTYKEGPAAGENNPADIRGMYSFNDISSLFGVPLEDLKVAFSVPAGSDPATFQAKNLETQFAGAPQEIGTGSVRYFVAFYKGLPIDLTIDTYLPAQAAQVLKAKGKMTAEQAAYLDKHTVVFEKAAPPAPAKTPVPGGTPVPSTTEHAAPANTVVGKTTFQDLLSWGVSKEAIEKVLGGAMPAPTTVIRDYATNKGVEFSTLKTALQVEIDKVKK